MPRFSNPTIGDAVLAQFTDEVDQLGRDLHQLEMAKRGALAGPKDHAVARSVDSRAARIARDLDWHRQTFELLFAGANPADARVQRLRAAIAELARRLGDLLAVGQPDRGKGSVARIVEQHREKLLKIQDIGQSVGAPAHHTIQMPGLPGGVSADPVLALAILLDVLRQVVLGTGKKK